MTLNRTPLARAILPSREGYDIAAVSYYENLPTFDHYGRFISRATDVRAGEYPVKNPNKGRNVMGYFAVDHGQFQQDIANYLALNPDVSEPEAEAFVEDKWSALAGRIGEGDTLYWIFIEVVVSREGVRLGHAYLHNVEIDEELMGVSTAQHIHDTLSAETDVIDEALAEAKKKLAALVGGAK